MPKIEKKYSIEKKIASGAECILYTGTDGKCLFCAKTIRNNIGKMLAPSRFRGHSEKQQASYRAKVKHLTNEFEIGRILFSEKDMPVVRMYDLRKVTRMGMEIGFDLLMEFVDGDDLSDKQALKMMDLHNKLNYAYQTIMALQYLHKRGVVHLDMKPSNVMISRGLVTLIDFGVSVPIGHKPTSIAGTVGYMAPEQIAKSPVDEATDIFSYGVTFAVVFGGAKLNKQKDLDMRNKNIQRDAGFSLTGGDVPAIDTIPEIENIPELHDLLCNCTIPQRDKRVKDSATIIRELQKIAKKLDIKLVEPTWSQQKVPIPPRKKYLETAEITSMLNKI